MGSDQIPSVAVDQLPTTVTPDVGPLLLDVREAEEWDAGHIAGAVHIPMGELLERIEEVPRDRDVVVICRSGQRSAAVTAYLHRGGWQARNLDGGMIAWDASGRPMANNAPHPPAVI
ncbi:MULTISPECIES: rhodanese-like domain-containing protein [Protofrankia]|uniref:Sulfurtransferase n=1 Tax=Protofrankia coriariae TaxID=1562887 RepID=A0ABR5F022_9ACTN|nr:MULTISPECIES: rhodanese-like domain-containing protein [Protofrankia]KLL10061.1 sulfurtransferase [Protofrankia coriariae]ONH31840.1 sulfurtransferase [Protofrankia sp. BMG5.30]